MSVNWLELLTYAEKHIAKNKMLSKIMYFEGPVPSYSNSKQFYNCITIGDIPLNV